MGRELRDSHDELKSKILRELVQDMVNGNKVVLATMTSSLIEVLVDHLEYPHDEIRELSSQALVAASHPGAVLQSHQAARHHHRAKNPRTDQEAHRRQSGGDPQKRLHCDARDDTDGRGGCRADRDRHGRHAGGQAAARDPRSHPGPGARAPQAAAARRRRHQQDGRDRRHRHRAAAHLRRLEELAAQRSRAQKPLLLLVRLQRQEAHAAAQVRLQDTAFSRRRGLGCQNRGRARARLARPVQPGQARGTPDSPRSSTTTTSSASSGCSIRRRRTKYC